MDVMKTITIDCARCLASPGSCDDCVVGVILDAGQVLSLNEDEQAAVAALATSRLVPPLRLLTADDSLMRDVA